MRFRNLDLNLLAALDKLIRLRSVSRAADELSITQSAMSNALSRLRQYFGDPLLVQVGRKMELTTRAEALAGPVRDILVRIEATIATPALFDPQTSTRVVGLMVSDYSLSTVVPPFVRIVAREAPHMRLTLKPQRTYPGLQLERGEADLLIAPVVYSSPDHPSELLLSDPMVCVVDARGPAAGGIDLEMFTTLEHVAMEPPDSEESYASRILRDAGVNISVAVSSYSFVSLPDLVEGTDRIALLQRRLAERAVAGRSLVIVEPPMPLAPLQQCIQWHSMRDKDPALAWLRAKLLEVAKTA